jgi:hypothetical protein
VLAAAVGPHQPVGRSTHRVIDLVGPEPVSYAEFVDTFAQIARRRGRPADCTIRSVPIEEADRLAAAGGYHGMPPDTLDCLLCNEVADAAPLAALLGRPLRGLDEAIAAAVDGTPLPQ